MSKPTPKYTLVEDYIKGAIKKKKITNKLPGERTLADQLGFSYMTIRKAVDNLVNEGLLYKVPTKGTFIHQTIQKNKKHTIGYFLDKSIQAGISSPYYSLIFSALEKEASENDYSIVYFSDADATKLKKNLSKLDGVIATCFPRTEHTIIDIKERLPVVVIDNRATDQSIPSVTIDNFSACAASVDYMYQLGHHHIGFMTGLDDSDVGRDRYAGYLHGLKQNGLAEDKNLVYRGNYSYEAGMDSVEYFLGLKQFPQAIICANDSMALGAIQRFVQTGFSVPHDISIVGFDDIEVASQIVPALTTSAAPIKEIARHAFSILTHLMNDTQPALQHITLGAQLVKRDSTAPLKSHAA